MNRTLTGINFTLAAMMLLVLAMTGGQATLLLDQNAGQATLSQTPARAVARDGLRLAVIRASADELAEHERYLALLDKQSGGKTLWRRFGSPAG